MQLRAHRSTQSHLKMPPEIAPPDECDGLFTFPSTVSARMYFR